MAAVPSTRRASGVEREPSPAGAGAEELYARHSAALLRFCLHQLGRRDDAEEAVQTTFLHALRALRRGVVPRCEEAWLVHIARNVCRTRWAAGRRRLDVEHAREPQVLAELAGARQPETLDLGQLRTALAALPEQQRRAVLLREWQGLSYREIAEELGATVPAVETMIYRGRAALAEALSPAEATGGRRRGVDLAGAVTWLKSLVGGGATAAKVAAVGVAVTAAAGGVAIQHATQARRSPQPAARPHPATPAQSRATQPLAGHAAERPHAAARRTRATTHRSRPAVHAPARPAAAVPAKPTPTGAGAADPPAAAPPQAAAPAEPAPRPAPAEPHPAAPESPPAAAEPPPPAPAPGPPSATTPQLPPPPSTPSLPPPPSTPSLPTPPVSAPSTPPVSVPSTPPLPVPTPPVAVPPAPALPELPKLP